MSAYMFLTSDAPLEEVWEPSDRPVMIDVDTKTIEGGEFDSCFSVLHNEPVWELSTDKPYFAALDIYHSGCEEEIAEYLKGQLQTVPEIELWHVWLDMDFGHKVRIVEIASNDLTAEDIRELAALNVCREPPVDYCYRLIRSGK